SSVFRSRVLCGGCWAAFGVLVGRFLGFGWALLGRSLGDARALAGRCLGACLAILGRSLVGCWALNVRGLGARWASAGRSMCDARALVGCSTLTPCVLCLGARWVIHAHTLCARLGRTSLVHCVLLGCSLNRWDGHLGLSYGALSLGVCSSCTHVW